MKLTDQQQAIVYHHNGPALVLAVAGAGKTTAMVHRIHHLINQHHVAPDRILATSFSKAAVADIRDQLADLRVPPSVQCQTLHALSLRIIRSAVQRGLADRRWIPAKGDNGDAMAGALFNRAFIELAKSERTDSRDLPVDREDLQNQISIWKGNLVYPDPERLGLPERAMTAVRKATHDNPLFPKAYRLYENLRQSEFLLTFDDMLQMAWELLSRHPELLRDEQRRFDMIMVDEFQDVNLVQFQITDLISAEHRNYMVIGDDDQCIYEWRGANPRFILQFEERYQAELYRITDNFRCYAQQVFPANAVIAHNRSRYAKHLSLTKGFDGETDVFRHKDDTASAKALVKHLKYLLDDGHDPAEIIILVRLYAQTAALESALLDEALPYEIIGNSPFYKRDEVMTLLQYLSFGEMEWRIRKKGFKKSGVDLKKYYQMFQTIINRPRRYLSREFIELCIAESQRLETSVFHCLQRYEEMVAERSLEHLHHFVQLVDKLTRQLGSPAHKTLDWLVSATGYREHLLEISGQRELGLSRIKTIEALISFAKGRGKTLAFLEETRNLAARRTDRDNAQVRIMTIHRAKGLDWETVFIPGCNNGMLPCLSVDEQGKFQEPTQEMEAERRLFYVALTRAKRRLFLYHTEKEPISPFLTEGDPLRINEDIEWLQRLLNQRKFLVLEKDLIRMVELVERFHLSRFLSHWSTDYLAFFKSVRVDLEELREKCDDAEGEMALFRSESARLEQEASQNHQRWLKDLAILKEMPVIIRKYKSSTHPVMLNQQYFFERTRDNDVVALGERGLVGFLHLSRMQDFPVDLVNWERCKGRVVGISDTGDLIELRLDQVATVPFSAEKAANLPEPPPAKIRTMAREGFRLTLDAILEMLAAG